MSRVAASSLRKEYAEMKIVTPVAAALLLAVAGFVGASWLLGDAHPKADAVPPSNSAPADARELPGSALRVEKTPASSSRPDGESGSVPSQPSDTAGPDEKVAVNGEDNDIGHRDGEMVGANSTDYGGNDLINNGNTDHDNIHGGNINIAVRNARTFPEGVVLARRTGVIVANSTARRQLARQVRDHLQKRGIRVGALTNFQPLQTVSFVLVSLGEEALGRRVAGALGGLPQRRHARLRAAVVVVVGEDHRSLHLGR